MAEYPVNQSISLEPFCNAASVRPTGSFDTSSTVSSSDLKPLSRRATGP
jgi:hypothetical protein